MERSHPGRRLSAALLSALSACAWTAEQGNGKPASEIRQVDPFHEIELGGALSAEIAVGPAQTVEVRGDDNLVPLVTTVVDRGRLQVRTTKTLRPKVKLLVHITVPSLTALTVSGAGRVLLRDAQGEDLALRLTGAADVTAAGSVRRVAFDVSGAGSVDARDLKAERATVTVSGAGDLDLYASQALDVHISGAGTVGYYGEPPEIRKEVSGAGTLERR